MAGLQTGAYGGDERSRWESASMTVLRRHLQRWGIGDDDRHRLRDACLSVRQPLPQTKLHFLASGRRSHHGSPIRRATRWAAGSTAGACKRIQIRARNHDGKGNQAVHLRCDCRPGDPNRMKPGREPQSCRDPYQPGGQVHEVELIVQVIRQQRLEDDNGRDVRIALEVVTLTANELRGFRRRTEEFIHVAFIDQGNARVDECRDRRRCIQRVVARQRMKRVVMDLVQGFKAQESHGEGLL